MNRLLFTLCYVVAVALLYGWRPLAAVACLAANVGVLLASGEEHR